MSEPRNRTKYSYDPVGNRLSSLGVSPYSVNTSNELTSTPTATYTYDNNGNTLTKVTSAGTTTYGWDYENRLTSVTLPGTGGTLAFRYDGLGHRVQKVFTQNSTSTTTNYLYDGASAVADMDQNGNVLARYTATQKLDEPLAERSSGTTSYYSQDGLGSVTSLTTSAGALGNTYRYDSFGNLTASSGSIANRFKYTAREFDPETGLYFYRARYYDSTSGRFISEDPAVFRGGINFYRYVQNGPINLSDPMGRCPDIKGFQKCVDNAISKILLREELLNLSDLLPFPTSERGLGYIIAGLGNGLSALGAEESIVSPTKGEGVLLLVLGQIVAVPGYVLIEDGSKERLKIEDRDLRKAIAACQASFLGR
jgi:RHS repeat-associated protein